MKFIVAGLPFPDTQVQLSISYIALNIFANSKARKLIPPKVMHEVVQHTLLTLSQAKEEDLQINLMGN